MIPANDRHRRLGHGSSQAAGATIDVDDEGDEEGGGGDEENIQPYRADDIQLFRNEFQLFREHCDISMAVFRQDIDQHFETLKQDLYQRRDDHKQRIQDLRGLLRQLSIPIKEIGYTELHGAQVLKGDYEMISNNQRNCVTDHLNDLTSGDEDEGDEEDVDDEGDEEGGGGDQDDIQPDRANLSGIQLLWNELQLSRKHFDTSLVVFRRDMYDRFNSFQQDAYQQLDDLEQQIQDLERQMTNWSLSRQPPPSE